jgi:hypothetical protein
MTTSDRAKRPRGKSSQVSFSQIGEGDRFAADTARRPGRGRATVLGLSAEPNRRAEDRDERNDERDVKCDCVIIVGALR